MADSESYSRTMRQHLTSDCQSIFPFILLPKMSHPAGESLGQPI